MPYVELHCHSYYSFQEGASSIEELVETAKSLDYPALALTDHDNVCGALSFAEISKSANIQPITGVEITLTDNSHLTLIAQNRLGYTNLCNLVTHAYMESEDKQPRLDFHYFKDYSDGLILLTGCSQGSIPSSISKGYFSQAELDLRNLLELFGANNVFIELQNNFVRGDFLRNARLLELGKNLGIPVVATNNVHYHKKYRQHLQDVLVAIKHNQSLETSTTYLKTNNHYHLKSSQQMEKLFRDIPQAIENTLKIAERCSFNLITDLKYQFPNYPVPKGHTQTSYLKELCQIAAIRRYGEINSRISDRLEEEFRLIEKHNLSGFLLIYHEIIQIAREVMVDLGLVDREIPLEERPPGRGRGSSVAMLVGYLIGLSHIDPLEFNLSLERFLPEDMASVPDIDLDFPRNIREELISRVHKQWGWDHAALTGMINTYRMKSAIQDIGKALSLPKHHLTQLSNRVDSSNPKDLKTEMESLPEFKGFASTPIWKDLIDLTHQLDGFPRYLAQHPGGMIFSSSPLTDMVPIQPASIEGRYICQWDKDTIDTANFIKIDFLGLGTLSQMQEILELIEGRQGKYIDLSRIDFNDQNVYSSIHNADTIGIFQIESSAQRQTTPRIKPSNLIDMAYEVAAVRPGVGANDGVTQFIKRRNGQSWEYDHPLEQMALQRTLGVILFQDQVNQLAIDVAGLSPLEADKLRRAFTTFNKRKNISHIKSYWEIFRTGSNKKGVPTDIAKTIFQKFNGNYMFPEAHAFAFGVTAYHMAWLKYHYPLEFFIAIFNQQPMGFYNLETLKEDAKRHSVNVLNPDINYSNNKCTIKNESLLLGLNNILGIGTQTSNTILEIRDRHGHFKTLQEVIQHTRLDNLSLERLIKSGAFDNLIESRKSALSQINLLYKPSNDQIALNLPVDQDMLILPNETPQEIMQYEYQSLGLYPKGHLMHFLRNHLKDSVLTSQSVLQLSHSTKVQVAGIVIRRQKPLGNAIYMTLEDETGHTPLVIWPQIYQKLKSVLREPIIIVEGIISRQDGTINVVVKNAHSLNTVAGTPKSKNWQ